MRQNTMKMSREQLGILQHLDKASVRYVAIGDFAMLAIDPARMLQHAQLWVEPVKQNLQRLNVALKAMFGPRTTRQVDPESTENAQRQGRQFSLGVGPFRVGIYFGVNGLKPDDFESVYKRSQAEQVAVPGQKEGGQTVRRLANADLYQQLKTENASHVGWNLDTLNKSDYQSNRLRQWHAGVPAKHKGQNVPYALQDVESQKGQLRNQAVGGETHGHPNHKGQFVPYESNRTEIPQPPVRNVDEIRRKLPVETVLNSYGFKPTTNPKEGEPWRTYDREVDGRTQRIVVGTLKETRQQQFYEVGNRAFQGDALELIRGLEKPLLKPDETIHQRTFQKVDELLTQSDFARTAPEIPPLRPVSSAYFLGTAATLNAQRIHDEYSLKPLSHTAHAEALGLTKATLHSPEFAGRVFEANGTNAEIDQKQTHIAFPLTDAKGKIVDVERVGTGRLSSDGQRHNNPDALWHSNRFYRAKTDILVTGDQSIPAGTVGIVQRTDPNHLAFHYTQDGRERIAKLAVEAGRSVLSEQSASRLVIGQSPLDVVAIKQLNPEVAGERRLYVATAGLPTEVQTNRIEQLLLKNPQAQVILATSRDTTGYQAVINQVNLRHPAADPSMRVSARIEPVQTASLAMVSERDVSIYFYPKETALRTADDLLKRFGYHTYSQSSADSTQRTGLLPDHVDHILQGREGVKSGTKLASTFSDKAMLSALTSTLIYAELHGIALPNQVRTIRDSPLMQQEVTAAKATMRRAYEQDAVDKQQLTLELRQPCNQPGGQQTNERFIQQFVGTLSAVAGLSPHPVETQGWLSGKPEHPVRELHRHTAVDEAKEQLVTRSLIMLPNESRLLGRAAELLVNEVNQRQGQRLFQLAQPTPQMKTHSEMLAARNGQPLPPTHRASLGQPEIIKLRPERGEVVGQKQPSVSIERQSYDRANNQLAEKQRPTVKVA